MAFNIKKLNSYSHNSSQFDTNISFDDNNNIHGTILFKRRTGHSIFKPRKIWKLKQFYSYEFELHLEHSSSKNNYFPIHFDHSFTTSTISTETNHTINNILFKFSIFPINKPNKKFEFASPIKEDIITFYEFINHKIEIDQLNHS